PPGRLRGGWRPRRIPLARAGEEGTRGGANLRPRATGRWSDLGPRFPTVGAAGGRGLLPGGDAGDVGGPGHGRGTGGPVARPQPHWVRELRRARGQAPVRPP